MDFLNEDMNGLSLKNNVNDATEARNDQNICDLEYFWRAYG